MESHSRLHVILAVMFGISIPSSAMIPELNKPISILRWKGKEFVELDSLTKDYR